MASHKQFSVSVSGRAMSECYSLTVLSQMLLCYTTAALRQTNRIWLPFSASDLFDHIHELYFVFLVILPKDMTELSTATIVPWNWTINLWKVRQTFYFYFLNFIPSPLIQWKVTMNVHLCQIQSRRSRKSLYLSLIWHSEESSEPPLAEETQFHQVLWHILVVLGEEVKTY